MTTQSQALADFTLRVKKGWALRVEEDQQGEEGKFWLAKIEDNPERLETKITFAGQVSEEGWIVAKASHYSFIRERGPVETKERVYKLLRDQTYLSMSHVVRLDRAVKLVNDAKSKSKPGPLVLTATEGARVEAAL